MDKKDYEFIEHTADVGIRVKGKDLKELFQNAARAMFDIIAEARPPVRQAGELSIKTITIEQKAENVEELFVNWLNELLSLASAKGVIFSGTLINSISENKLIATVTAEPADSFKSNVEIKAATYHQLKVVRVGGAWQAEVIFDV